MTFGQGFWRPTDFIYFWPSQTRYLNVIFGRGLWRPKINKIRWPPKTLTIRLKMDQATHHNDLWCWVFGGQRILSSLTRYLNVIFGRGLWPPKTLTKWIKLEQD